MNIWVDGYEANVSQRLGSGQIAYELIRTFEANDLENDYTVFLPDKPVLDMPAPREGFKYEVLKPKFFWTRLALPLKIKFTKNKPHVFFSPTHYIPNITNIKRVCTIFDLAFLHFPQTFQKKDLYKLINWTKYSILNSSHIITISNSTKKDLLKNYKIPKEKITVAYPGYDNSIYMPINDSDEVNQVKRSYGIEGKYIIFIGTVQPKKNIIKLIESFKNIENLKLVIVGKAKGDGKEGWMYDEILSRPKELGIEEKVVFTGFVPDSKMPYLINGAEAFILPSLWEGFGIPVIEAMACGTPVIASNVSSLPEVIGNAGLLVNPDSADQIEQAIRTISTDKKLRDKLSKLGLERAKKFSFKKMAKEVIQVLKSV